MKMIQKKDARKASFCNVHNVFNRLLHLRYTSCIVFFTATVHSYFFTVTSNYFSKSLSFHFFFTVSTCVFSLSLSIGFFSTHCSHVHCSLSILMCLFTISIHTSLSLSTRVFKSVKVPASTDRQHKHYTITLLLVTSLRYTHTSTWRLWSRKSRASHLQ